MSQDVTQRKKQVALVAAVLSAVYLFIPEPTDLVPILGWLDEGMALAVFGWSMRVLGLDPRRWVAREPAPRVITVKAE